MIDMALYFHLGSTELHAVSEAEFVGLLLGEDADGNVTFMIE